MTTAVATPVREHPLLMSGAMVRATLNGTKTQTRRVLRVQPLEILTPTDRRAKSLARVTRKWNGKRVWFSLTHRDDLKPENNRGSAFRCSYGEVGDRLWVRETFFASLSNIAADPVRERPVIYRADDEVSGDWSFCGKWKPSIHMPRWASRLTLEIANVSVERLQDVSENDAQDEGVCCRGGHPHGSKDQHRGAYKKLWNELNAKRGYGWDKNPWVWVIEFKAVTP